MAAEVHLPPDARPAAICILYEFLLSGCSRGPGWGWRAQAALEFMLQTQRQPDIIHAHDWSTALTTKFFWESYVHNGLWKPRCIFTIHNLEFGAAKARSLTRSYICSRGVGSNRMCFARASLYSMSTS